MILLILQCERCGVWYAGRLPNSRRAVRVLRRQAAFDGWGCTLTGHHDACPACLKQHEVGRIARRNTAWSALLANLRAHPEPRLWADVVRSVEGWVYVEEELSLMEDLGLVRPSDEDPMATGWGLPGGRCRYVLAPEEQWPDWVRSRFGVQAAPRTGTRRVTIKVDGRNEEHYV